MRKMMTTPNLKLEPTNPDAVTGDERVKVPAVSNRKNWVPKKWEPLFDEWVLRSVLGTSNIAIAAHYGYTRQHVSAVLNTPQAKLLRRQLHDNLRKNIELKTTERIEHIQDKALSRMTQVIDDDQLAAAQPFAMFDRSVAILKGTGIFKSDEKAGINAKNAIFLAPELAKGILEGIRMADKAKQLNAGTLATEVITTGKEIKSGK